MKRVQQSRGITENKMSDIVRRLEEGLFKMAAMKVSYFCTEFLIV